MPACRNPHHTARPKLNSVGANEYCSAKMPNAFATISESEKEVWLVQHVPHRICAALTWLDMGGAWTMPKPPDMPKTGDFHVWCLNRSVEEGHLAAMRWLIEFIGVTLNQSEKPVPPNAHKNGKSVSIAQVGAPMFPITSHVDAALFLGKVWQACSQASLHPTTDTRHMDLPAAELARALGIVIDYLQSSLYGPKGRDLHEIVRSQEHRAIERGKSGQFAEGARANVVVRFTTSS
jgi:hypothetical protein